MRRPGYYWVKDPYGYWEVMYWNMDQKIWRSVHDHQTYRDQDLREIDERRLEHT